MSAYENTSSGAFMRIRTLSAVYLLILFIFTAASPAAAERDMEPGRNFQLSVTPYAWLFDLKGTVGARGYSLHVDAPFTESTKHLNFAGMAAIDAMWRNSFGITANLNLAVLGGGNEVRGISLDSSSSLFISDAAGFYRAVSVPFCTPGSGFHFDLIGGARIWRAGIKLDVSLPGGSRQFSQSEVWADPIAGARAVFALNDRWSLRLRGGYGGFSVSSKKTWDAAAVVGYKFRERVSVVAGYRAVGVDYRKGSGRDRLIFDAVMRGPLAGVVFSF